jgi:hypothetical protein
VPAGAKSRRQRSGRSLFLGLVLAWVAVVCGIITFERFLAQANASPPISVPVRFTDVRQAAGITWQEDATPTEAKNYIETMGTGPGWIDYDQDGLLDLYLVQAAGTEWYTPSQPLYSALYRNNGDGTFTDVTKKAGVGAEGLYGQGVAVGEGRQALDGFQRNFQLGEDHPRRLQERDGFFQVLRQQLAIGSRDYHNAVLTLPVRGDESDTGRCPPGDAYSVDVHSQNL